MSPDPLLSISESRQRRSLPTSNPTVTAGCPVPRICPRPDRRHTPCAIGAVVISSLSVSNSVSLLRRTRSGHPTGIALFHVKLPRLRTDSKGSRNVATSSENGRRDGPVCAVHRTSVRENSTATDATCLDDDDIDVARFT